MEPLTPNDPLWNLLGQSKPVKVRPNFVQNVVRAARQTPQERGWLAALSSWWSSRQLAPVSLAWAAAIVIASVSLAAWLMPRDQAPALAAQSGTLEEMALHEADFLVPEFEMEWKTLETLGDLLAVQDTSQLTDQEIHLLLY